jgi:hypothetical protein
MNTPNFFEMNTARPPIFPQQPQQQQPQHQQHLNNYQQLMFASSNSPTSSNESFDSAVGYDETSTTFTHQPPAMFSNIPATNIIIPNHQQQQQHINSPESNLNSSTSNSSDFFNSLQFGGSSSPSTIGFMTSKSSVTNQLLNSNGRVRSASNPSPVTSPPKISKSKKATAPMRRTGPVRRSKKGGWSEDEDEMLRKAVQMHNGKNWKKIAEMLQNRSSVQCLHRWQKVLNPNLVKGPWSKQEDETIVRLVATYGAENWSMIASHLPGRIGKQCRERWYNHLDPSVKKEPWSEEEEQTLLETQQKLGNKWAEISKFLPGRPDNACKNHFNSLVARKKKAKNGASDEQIEPLTPSSTQSESPSSESDTNVSSPLQTTAPKATNAAIRRPRTRSRKDEMQFRGHQRSLSDTVLLQFSQAMNVGSNPFSPGISTSPQPTSSPMPVSPQSAQYVYPTQQQQYHQISPTHTVLHSSPVTQQYQSTSFHATNNGMHYTGYDQMQQHQSFVPISDNQMQTSSQYPSASVVGMNHHYHQDGFERQELIRKQLEIQKLQLQHQQEELERQKHIHKQQQLELEKQQREFDEQQRQIQHFQFTTINNNGNNNAPQTVHPDISISSPTSPFTVDFSLIDGNDDFPKLELSDLSDQPSILSVKQENDEDIDFTDQNMASVFDVVDNQDKNLYNSTNNLFQEFLNRPDQRDLVNVEIQDQHARKRKKLSHGHMRSQSFDVSLLSQLPKRTQSSRDQFFF